MAAPEVPADALLLPETGTPSSPAVPATNRPMLRHAQSLCSYGMDLAEVTDHFSIWVPPGPLASTLTITDYAVAAEKVWARQITTFGFPEPPTLPTAVKYEIAIDPFLAVAGYTAYEISGEPGNNPSTPWNDLDATATCIGIAPRQEDLPSAKLAAESVLAHEFIHAIQLGMGVSDFETDPVFTEGLATLMMDETFDSSTYANRFLWPDTSVCLGAHGSNFSDEYKYWQMFRAMTERFGSSSVGGIESWVQDFFELSSKNEAVGLDAINAAFVRKGTTLKQAFHDGAITLHLNKACGSGYTYPHCFEEAASYAAASPVPTITRSITGTSGVYTGTLADNFSSNAIRLAGITQTFGLTLANTSAGGELRGSVVCDTGNRLIVTPIGIASAQSVTRSIAINPTGCQALHAIVTNQAQTAANPTMCENRAYSLTAFPVGGTPARKLFLPFAAR